MALTVGTDSYVSVSDADEALGKEFRSTSDWFDQTQDAKEGLLRLATRLLDDHFIWSGRQRYSDPVQALEWPRYGVYDRNGYYIDQDTVPKEVERATIEMARNLAIRDRTADNTIETLDISESEGTKFYGDGGAKVIPDSVYYLIPASFYYEIRKRARPGQSARVAQLVRG